MYALYLHPINEESSKKNDVCVSRDHENIFRATKDLLYQIYLFKYPKDKSMTTPVDTEHPHNIFIYEVNVYKNVKSEERIIKKIRKALPELREKNGGINDNTLDRQRVAKYIDLCDLDGMTIGKLAVALYGENMSVEEYEKRKKEYFEESIKKMNQEIPVCLNKKPITWCAKNGEDEHKKDLIYHTLICEFVEHYRDKYFVHAEHSFYNDYKFFFYDKKMMDDLVKDFKIKFPKFGDDLPNGDKKYCFDKFMLIFRTNVNKNNEYNVQGVESLLKNMLNYDGK